FKKLTIETFENRVPFWRLLVRRKRFWLLLGYGLFLYFVGFMAHFYESNEAWISAIGWDKKAAASSGTVRGPERDMRFIRLGSDLERPLLVFVHGAPGSGLFWNPLLIEEDLQEAANLLVYDRPGYGGSDYGRAMMSVESHAAHLAALIANQRMADQKVVVIGSSYGGTVAARLAMDYPHLIDALMLQSASLLPKAELTLGITYPTTHWSLRWLIPGAWDVANQEKLSHKDELLDMLSGWDNIQAETILIQGSADWLIYPQNSYFACRELDDQTELIHHMVPDGAHDLIWTKPQLLKDYLMQLLEND
ncbi:MAG: alpha/beta hydrolase, partial [Bacteroidota bacterium]